MSFDEISLFWSGLTALATVIGLIFVSYQFNESRKTSRAVFLLSLDERFREYSDLNNQLQIRSNTWHPLQPSMNGEKIIHPGFDFDLLFTYLGLFERIKLLIDDGTLKLTEIDRLYGYRVRHITKNDYLFNFVKDNPQNWQDFIKLCKQLALFEKKKHNHDDDFIKKCSELSIITTPCEEDFRNC